MKAITRRATISVGKILTGVKPADPPVDRPTKFELIINLKNAKRVSVTIRRTALARADKMIC